jgi:hypothetical protein
MEILDHIQNEIKYASIRILFISFLFSCQNQDTRSTYEIKNTIETERLNTKIHSTFTEIHPQFSVKRTDGFLFTENELSRIELKLYKNQSITQDVVVSVYSFNDNSWKLEFKDSLMDLVFLCDSIFDINGNGKHELVIQRLEGVNGNFKSYFSETYGFSNGVFSKLKTLSQMENLSFQIDFQTVTTLYRDWCPSNTLFFLDESTTRILFGKKYKINNANELKHIETQVLISLPNATFTNTYKIENKKATLFKKSKSNTSLDSEYYGFLYWCDKK